MIVRRREEKYNFIIKQGNLWPPIVANLLYDDGDPIDLTAVDKVHIVITRRNDRNNVLLNKPVAVTNLAEAEVTYRWEDEETDWSGEYQFEFVIYYLDGVLLTIPKHTYYYLWIQSSLDFP